MTTKRQVAVAVIAKAIDQMAYVETESHFLQPLGGKPILHHVLDNMSLLKPVKTFVIVGSNAKRVISTLEDRENIQFVHMVEKGGTERLVQQIMPLLEGFRGDLIVIDGSMPLLSGLRVTRLWAFHRDKEASATITATLKEDPKKSGPSVFLDSDDVVHHLTHFRHITTAEQKNDDINAGVSCFYWPDVVALLETNTLDDKTEVHQLYKLFHPTKQAIHLDPAVQEFVRLSNKKELTGAYRLLQKYRRDRWMLRGVTFLDPDSVTVDETVVIGDNVIIEPQTHLRGKTKIGDGCCIGPGTFVENSEIGARCKVRYSVVSDSTVASETWIGPYAHLRANARIGEECRVGNFVEIKNASLGKRTCTGHLAYLGDAELGNDVNIGAGTVTANFDGFKKHKTIIYDGAKTGANSVLVAPVTIGSRVTIGAGSTVTEDVSNGALVVARARQIVKPNWKPKPK